MSARSITIALALFVAIGASHAQQAGAPEPASAEPAKATCVQKKRHDHGAERNAPTPQPRCKDAAPVTQGSDGKPIKGHDHARTHKLM